MLDVSNKRFSFGINETLQVRDGELKLCGLGEEAKRFLLPGYDKKEIQAVADFIFDQLQNTEKKNTYLSLANSFVAYYQGSVNGNKISQVFDRHIARVRPSPAFHHRENLAALTKWQRYEQDGYLYLQHPEFCTFMETSGLLSQIKITRDFFTEIDGEPALKVQGQWMKWSKFKNDFTCIYSERYREKFIVNREQKVFTYLDNGKGLQLHHPYLTENNAISTLTSDEYAKTLATAHKFIREGEQNLTALELQKLNLKRTFIIQLVSSHVKGLDTHFNNLITNTKHPFLRLIIGRDNAEFKTSKGEVYEVGYMLKDKLTVPLITSQGRFRSPDYSEYLLHPEKIVTNIAVTPEEAKAFNEYVTDYHRSEVNIGNPMGFHFFKQNCTTFVSAALEAANVNVPKQITLENLWFEVMPSWISKINTFFIAASHKAVSLANRAIGILPQSLKTPIRKTAQKIYRLGRKAIEAVTAMWFIPLKIALGEAFGKGGKAFVKKGETPKAITPNLKSIKPWFALSSYKVSLPGILQRWQKEQASTVIYEKPIKLCIVP